MRVLAPQVVVPIAGASKMVALGWVRGSVLVVGKGLWITAQCFRSTELETYRPLFPCKSFYDLSYTVELNEAILV